MPFFSGRSQAIFQREKDAGEIPHLVHAIPGRARLRPSGACGKRAVAALLTLCPCLQPEEIRLSPRTGGILVLTARPEAWEQFALAFSLAPEPPQPAAARPVARQKTVPNPLPGRIIRLFLPPFLRRLQALWQSLPDFLRGARGLFSGRLNLDVLDGAALTVCLTRRDFRSLSTIVFFFSLSEFLTDWTRKKSWAGLRESLALKIDQVWVRVDGRDSLRPLQQVRPGDLVVVHAGSVIPVDGIVAGGDGLVNQASLTGEPLPVPKRDGAGVYAGTVLEEGELVIAAAKVDSESRIASILRAIEASEGVKASIQARYESIADAIVPYNFLLSALVFACTGSPLRAGAFLLVDYSCAIRLATPLSLFAGMREAAERGALIKGGKFMEAAARADMVIFDKTGTLTMARPTVVEVLTFGGHEAETLLRLAACLEEHFPHPVGQSVARAAEKRGLKHREEHARMDYVVAHGIASRWREQRVLIGSEHFVLEDEGAGLSPEQAESIRQRTSKGLSALYLAVGGETAGVLFIEDSIREEAAEVVRALRRDGIKRIVMLTGDGLETASGIAARAGITEYRAHLLPEDKARFIAECKRQGHIVLMVGDGINDSPALSEADVGLAMAEGADMAREIADIVLTNGRLSGILMIRELSRQVLSRVRGNFRASLLWNSLFLIGGLLGVLTPGTSALMHNATTAAIAVRSVRPFLPPDPAENKQESA
ncbi:MAG: heavy metal translocating P-type ATPase [Deltaproteobacteria bacterium]|jgi:Cu2+-exporting ATPase|nr:heavy metal translocating P-type ATPase [Deltaproteobacteria bacterium]